MATYSKHSQLLYTSASPLHPQSNGLCDEDLLTTAPLLNKEDEMAGRVAHIGAMRQNTGQETQREKPTWKTQA
jgi:hypothetical protein